MQDLYERIYKDENFQQLEKERSRFSWQLSSCVFVIYFSFILIVAFKPSLFANTLSQDTVITYGIPIGVLIIVISFILTGIYTRKANSEFDEKIKIIIEKAKQEN